jgi:hypothetical protein
MKAIKKYVYHSQYSGYNPIKFSKPYDTLEEAEADIDNFLKENGTIPSVIIIPTYYKEESIIPKIIT